VEKGYGKSIDAVLRDVISAYNTWNERSAVLGVSKVTMYTWVRRYLKMTPQQSVLEIKEKKKVLSVRKQAGVRDYLTSTVAILIPE
jgi:hypothetical protein